MSRVLWELRKQSFPCLYQHAINVACNGEPLGQRPCLGPVWVTAPKAENLEHLHGLQMAQQDEECPFQLPQLV